MYEQVPSNRSERRETSVEAATDICRFHRNHTDTNASEAIPAAGKQAKNVARRAHFAGQIANERMGADVPLTPLRTFRSGTGDATKYLPLIGSYATVAETACQASQNQTADSIRAFHVSMVMFAVDATLISSGGFYRPAFAGTRAITNSANTVGLYRLRYLCGDRCWALAMSEIHWGLRGTMRGATTTIVRTSVETGFNLTVDDLRSVASSQEVNQSVLLRPLRAGNVSLRNVSSADLARVQNATVRCSGRLRASAPTRTRRVEPSNHSLPDAADVRNSTVNAGNSLTTRFESIANSNASPSNATTRINRTTVESALNRSERVLHNSTQSAASTLNRTSSQVASCAQSERTNATSRSHE
jgi:hypothetical protein